MDSEKDITKKFNCNNHPFSCETCCKSFPSKSKLIRHELVHTGERPFKCVLCDKKFSDTSALTKHKKTHTGEKPYSCGICKKKFSQYCNLIDHIKTHTEERPYSCDICVTSFKRNSTLLRHNKTTAHLKNKESINVEEITEEESLVDCSQFVKVEIDEQNPSKVELIKNEAVQTKDIKEKNTEEQILKIC